MSYELLPPGFRFHETFILQMRNSLPRLIPEVNIYKFDPWELPAKSNMCDGEGYFFTPRDRKYPKGTRPNRATRTGYGKATGNNKAIRSGSRLVGIKKALVFYQGRPPRGTKTRVSGSTSNKYPPNGSMRLDDWVLCRIYEKGHQKRAHLLESNREHDQSDLEDKAHLI